MRQPRNKMHKRAFKADLQWFADNPTKTFVTRRAYPGEFPDVERDFPPPPGRPPELWVAIQRDGDCLTYDLCWRTADGDNLHVPDGTLPWGSA